MAFLIRPTTVEDEARLTEFLTRVFPVNASLVSPAMLRWKYWNVREDCPEPRSFVGERNGRIVAHAGLWPVTLRNGTKSERGVHAMDWAADPYTLGAGWNLIKDLTKNYDFVYGIGGEEITRAILPKLGFRPVAEALTWARPIRPWRRCSGTGVRTGNCCRALCEISGGPEFHCGRFPAGGPLMRPPGKDSRSGSGA